MAEDPLLFAQALLEGAIFVEVAFNVGGVGLILQTNAQTAVRLSADAVGPADTPVPNDDGLLALNGRAVELVTPLFGARIANLQRRGDNVYILAFEGGEKLGLFRSSDDKITDNVVLIGGPDLCVLLE